MEKLSDEVLKCLADGHHVTGHINNLLQIIAAELLSTRAAHAREVDQFNDGYKAAKDGLPESDQPHYEIDEDQWRVGYAWGKYDELKAALSALQEATRWIPVEERLPNECEECLLLNKNKSQFVGWLDEASLLMWIDTIEGYVSDDVTHWMPLPVLPEGGTK